MKSILFDFEKAKDKALVTASRLFQKAGAQVVSTDVAQTLSKRAGVAFRSIAFTFADGQVVVMNVKTTGDVFEVKVNGSTIPLRHQDDHGEAITEIAGWLERKRAAFQRALAKANAPVPAGIRTSAVNTLKAKTAKRDGLLEAVGLAREELSQLTSA
ncbi:hypothetical protein [Ideonella sp.]|uniref:defense against restriction DarA-related protein n=1 Tax=Ideonella sp. TaxID=1929293 RepID=UPI0035AFFC14